MSILDKFNEINGSGLTEIEIRDLNSKKLFEAEEYILPLKQKVKFSMKQLSESLLIKFFPPGCSSSHDGHLAYIRINEDGDFTCRDFSERKINNLEDLSEELILWLKNNGAF